MFTEGIVVGTLASGSVRYGNIEHYKFHERDLIMNNLLLL